MGRHAPNPEQSIARIGNRSEHIAQLDAAYSRAVTRQLRRLSAEEAAFRQQEYVRHIHQPRPAEEAPVYQLAGIVTDLLVILLWHIRHGYARLLSNARRHRRYIIAATGCCTVTMVGFFLVVVLLPQSVTYLFAKTENCLNSPTFFPSLLHYEQTSAFVAHRPTGLSIAGITIVSTRLCVRPQISPGERTGYDEQQAFELLGLHLHKNLRIMTGAYPTVLPIDLTPTKAEALPLIKPLNFKLASQDALFAYALSANHKTALCTKRMIRLSCSLSPLELSYGAPYRIQLIREFRSSPSGVALNRSVQTINATGIMSTSIEPNSLVYSVPQQITLQTSKPLVSVHGVSLTYMSGGKPLVIPTSVSFKDSNISVLFSRSLPRQTAFTLHIANVTADDQSQLEQAFSLNFTTSGGPTVTEDTLPAYGVESEEPIALTFSQPLLVSQSANELVSLEVNDKAVPAQYALSGKQIIITPQTNYPVCAAITLNVANAVQSNYGIAGSSAYSFSTRSHCYTAFSIGNSVRGRPITGYKFGSGSSMVLYIGAMEGNEQNASNLLTQWIPDIDANPGKIPAYRTIVVIPTINPDGYAADTRLNADGIDLNRNFPANNWQTQVTEPLANTVWTNDGGPYPLSEPESQALASYYLANKPRLTLTMHSHGGIVEANDAGDSINLGNRYAQLAEYRAIPTSAIGSFFDYTTTGAFEDWAHDKVGLPVLEVELESPTNDEYSRNLSAMWAMAKVSP